MMVVIEVGVRLTLGAPPLATPCAAATGGGVVSTTTGCWLEEGDCRGDRELAVRRRGGVDDLCSRSRTVIVRGANSLWGLLSCRRVADREAEEKMEARMGVWKAVGGCRV